MQAASAATAAATRSVWLPLRCGGSGFPGSPNLPLKTRSFGLAAVASSHSRNSSSGFAALAACNSRSSRSNRISRHAGYKFCSASTWHLGSGSSCSSVMPYPSVTPFPFCSTAFCFSETQKPFPFEKALSKSQVLSRSPLLVLLGAAVHSGTHAAQFQQHEQRSQQQQQKRNLHQQQKPKQQQHEQQVAGVLHAEGIAYPKDYSALPSTCSSSTETSSNNSRKTFPVEQLGFLPLWARRFQPPQRETFFLRVLPVAPLVAMALGVHVLPRKC